MPTAVYSGVSSIFACTRSLSKIPGIIDAAAAPINGLFPVPPTYRGSHTLLGVEHRNRCVRRCPSSPCPGCDAAPQPSKHVETDCLQPFSIRNSLRRPSRSFAAAVTDAPVGIVVADVTGGVAERYLRGPAVWFASVRTFCHATPLASGAVLSERRETLAISQRSDDGCRGVGVEHRRFKPFVANHIHVPR